MKTEIELKAIARDVLEKAEATGVIGREARIVPLLLLVDISEGKMGGVACQVHAPDGFPVAETLAKAAVSFMAHPVVGEEYGPVDSELD